MWSVDSLQNHLIREVALTGEKGISFFDVGPIITSFYSSQATAKEETNCSALAGLFPESPTRRLSKYFRSNASIVSTNPDGSICEKVWGWLQSHPDTLIRTNHSSEPFNLKSARHNVEEETRPAKYSPSRSQRNYGPEQVRVDVESLIKKDHRIYGTESRIWQAVAGHAIDYQKIHALEFRLLTIIGNRKKQGIIQPDLIRISGQDKRSVPKRTDKLQDYGYIIKRPVIWNGMRTSHCTLKEFAVLSDANTTDSSGYESVDCLDITKFLRELFTILQKTKIIPLSELRLAMGSSGHRRETKFLALAIRRLEILGCLKRVLAKVTDKPTEVIRWMQCVKYIKVPTDDEREALTTMTHDQEALIRASQQQDDQDSTSVTEPHWLASSANDLNDELNLPGQSMMKPNPCWTPYLSYFDLIYGSVEEFGAKGISSMKLRDHIFGPFCKKPFDVIISRLTDDGRTSQPFSLQHLTLIKDTSFLDRVSHYNYRTYYNFRLAIESGEAAEEVLQTLKINSPPQTAALPWAADGGHSGLSNTYNNTLLDLHRTTSVSASIKLSGPKLNDRRGKRRSQLASSSRKSSQSSKGVRLANEISLIRENYPRKRGRPRKHPEKEGSQRRPCAISNNNNQLEPNQLKNPSSFEICEKVPSEVWLSVNLNTQESELDAIQSSSAPYVQKSNAEGTVRKRKRPSTNSRETPIKSVKIIQHPQSYSRHDIRKSSNESLVSIFEQELCHRTKLSAGLRKNSTIGHYSIYESGHNRKSAGINLKNQEYRKQRGQNAVGRSLVAVIRSNKLRLFDWFNKNTNQSSKVQCDHEEDMENSYKDGNKARNMISKQSVGKSPRLTSTLLSERSARSNEVPTDFRTNLSGKNTIPDQFYSMVVDPEVSQLNKSQISNNSPKPALDFRGAATAEIEKDPISTAASIVRDVPLNLEHSSRLRPSAMNGSSSINLFDNHEAGNAESSIRTQENEKLASNADFTLKNGHSAENQITNCSESLNVETQQQHEPRQQPVQSGLNKELNPGHVKDFSIRSEGKILPKKQKPHINGGSITHQRTQIVLNLVQKCEGVFPGGSEICLPFSSLWKRIYGTTTDSRTIMRAVKDAVDCGKLRRVHFSFRSKDGIVFTRSVLTLINIAPDSPSVRVLQRAMIDSFPKLYRPPQIEDNVSSKPLTVLRHVFRKDLSCPAERQYRPLYLQKLEEHRASMANKRLTRSLENHGSARKKVRQNGDQIEYLTNSQQLPGLLAGGGVTRLSRLPRLSSLASSRQMSLGRKTFISSSVCVDRNFNIAPKTRDQQSDKLSAPDALYMYQKLQPTMKIDQSDDRMMNFVVDFGLQEFLDGTTTLMEPTQLFQPSTGTFTTEFSNLRLKVTFSREKLAESVQPILERVMPRSVTEMRRPRRNIQSQQDGSRLDQEYLKFSQEIKEVATWERSNENLVSSDLKLQRARFINHTAPKIDCHGHSRPHSIDATGIGSIYWLPSDTRHHSASNKLMEFEARQRNRDAGYDYKLSKRNHPRFSSDYSTPDPFLSTAIIFGSYHDTAYWPRMASTHLPVSSILGDFSLLSSLFQKSSLPPIPSENQSVVRVSDKREVQNRPSLPERNRVGQKVIHHAKDSSLMLATNTSNDNSAHVAEEDSLTKSIQSNKLKKRQRHRIRKKALLIDTAFSRRFLLTVSVIRILSGGIERLIDWDLVLRSSREFSQMTPSSLKKQWLLLKRNLYSGTELNETRIQEALLIALERGHTPSPDFQDLRKCDWKAIVDLVHQILDYKEKLSKEHGHNEIAETKFTHTGKYQIQDVQAIRNELNSQSTLQMRRDHLLTVLPSWEILHSTKSDKIAPDVFSKNLQECKARSWVRANILTPSESYCPEAALEKLQQLGEEGVTCALKFFEERNLVREASNRTKNLRNLEMSESFYANFRTPINSGVLEDAGAYKAYLDNWIMSNCSDSETVELQSSDKGDNSLSIDPASPSGTFLAITNLAANDRVTVSPRSVPLGIGFDDPSPSTLEYNLEIRPSSQYIKGNPLYKSGRKWLPAAPTPSECDAAGKIPLWVDIHGNHLQQWWDRVRACILGLIATRSGISINGLTYALNELMENWEISAVVRWLIDVEAVKWLDEAFCEEGMHIELQFDKGLSVREWWWMAMA